MQFIDACIKIYRRIGEWYKNHISWRLTPLFLAMLCISFIMWYASKLQYTYTASVPMMVTVDGHRHRIECVVEGSGHNILSMQFFNRKKIKLKVEDVELLPVEGMENAYKVSNQSLQSAISLRTPDIKIISVGDFPFLEYPQ